MLYLQSLIDSAYKQVEETPQDININSNDRMESKRNKLVNESDKMHSSIVESESDTDTQSLIIIDTIRTLTKSTMKRRDLKVAAMRILLTYQGVKLDKIDLLEYIINIVKGKIIEEYVIVYDNYEKDYMYHTHVYIKLNKTFQSSNRNIFNFSDLRPNIERVLQHKADIMNVLVYLFERDTDPYTNLVNYKVNLIKQEASKLILSSNDSLKSSSKDNILIKRIDNIEFFNSCNFTPWQRFLLNIIQNEVDERVFYWCLEPKGFTEKAILTKYICSNYKNVLLINKIDNVTNIYLETIKTCPIEIVILDLSWKASNSLLTSKTSDIFDFIEILKMGCISDNTFQSGALILKPCHVIVFSSCLTGIKEIEAYRWKIIKILDDNEAYLGIINKQGEIEYDKTHIVDM